MMAFRLDSQAMLIAVSMGASQTTSFVIQKVVGQITSELGQHANSEL